MNMDEQTNIPRRAGRPPNPRPLAADQIEHAAPEVAPRPAARIPFGTPQLKLGYEKRPGFHRHIFNDVPGRIQRAQNAGYAHVKDREGNNVKTTVGVAKEGGGLTGYLMEIPDELYDADQAAKMQAINAFDESLRRGVDSGGHAPGQDGRYIPKDAYGRDKISIDRR
jgi:hypothetical protein